MKERITGFDVARALAIFGMVIVNFKISMNAETGDALLMQFAALFEGRASALFVILAGVGITFLTHKARRSNDREVISQRRWMVLKRGVLLIAIGLLYTPVWEADILHFYGFYFLVAAFIFMLSDKALFRIAIIIMLMFPLLMLFFNYDQNWNWKTLSYENLWSIDGMFRHIFFNGYHPVVPWSAFLVFGMWLGRQDLSQPRVRKKLLLSSLALFLIIEIGFYLMRVALGDGSAFDMTPEDVSDLFTISAIPPLPQYILSAGSSAVVTLMLCLYFSEKFRESVLNKWLYKTGQLSLTLYMAHVLVGMGFLEAIGRLQDQSIEFSLLSALVFCLLGMVFSVLWLRYFAVGPLEWVFRKLAN